MKTAEFVQSFGLKFLEVAPGSKAGLSRRDTRWSATPELEGLDDGAIKKQAVDYLEGCRQELADLRDRLYADDRYAVMEGLSPLRSRS